MDTSRSQLVPPLAFNLAAMCCRPGARHTFLGFPAACAD